MSRKKIDAAPPLSFQIRAIELLGAAIHAPEKGLDLKMGVSFSVSMEQKLDTAQHCLVVITNVDITPKGQPEHHLASFSIACVFQIGNYNELIEQRKGKYIVPAFATDIMNSISLSTTRGVLSQHLRGTYLHHVILPVMNPKSFKTDKN